MTDSAGAWNMQSLKSSASLHHLYCGIVYLEFGRMCLYVCVFALPYMCMPVFEWVQTSIFFIDAKYVYNPSAPQLTRPEGDTTHEASSDSAPFSYCREQAWWTKEATQWCNSDKRPGGSCQHSPHALAIFRTINHIHQSSWTSNLAKSRQPASSSSGL